MAAPTERSFLATAGSSSGRVIPTPFQFFSTGEDNIRVISVNSKTGVSLKVNMRFVDNAGTITATSWDHTPNTDRTVKSSDQALGQGAVMNLTVFAGAGSPNVGQTFVIVQMIRGLGPAAIVLGTLLQGYVTATQALGWPGSAIVSSTDGEPNVRNIVGTQPAQGVEISEVVPTNARWEVVSLFFSLLTNAAVINRNVLIDTVSGGVEFGEFGPGINIPANTSQRFVYAQNLPVFGIVSPLVEYMALPQRLFLRGGDSFKTTTVNGQPGDLYSQPFYQVREWLEAA